jgi:transcriptional regulator with XRE-family HTH domain
MISLIERGEASPTAVTLEKLATALGVVLASLFDSTDAAAAKPASPVSRREDQPEWRDPASGYLRRNVSPPGISHPMQIVEVLFPPKARVAFETADRDGTVFQQIWILEGAMNVTAGDELHRLREGDCLAMQLNCPTMFHNPTARTTRYAVVLVTPPSARR